MAIAKLGAPTSQCPPLIPFYVENLHLRSGKRVGAHRAAADYKFSGKFTKIKHSCILK